MVLMIVDGGGGIALMYCTFNNNYISHDCIWKEIERNSVLMRNYGEPKWFGLKALSRHMIT